ncbi:MAG: cytochrome c [Weeksellaceae bacterium]|nr:cytochrome c [Weeksellaceae bacterium]
MKDQHKILIFTLLAVSFFSYSGFLYSANSAYKTAEGTSSDRGKRLWQEKNCIACHQIYGLGGYLGPDLTNSYSQRGPDYIKAFLRSGTMVMPNYGFTEIEIQDLAQYMKSIDESGIGMPSKLKINYDGTVQQP